MIKIIILTSLWLLSAIITWRSFSPEDTLNFTSQAREENLKLPSARKINQTKVKANRRIKVKKTSKTNHINVDRKLSEIINMNYDLYTCDMDDLISIYIFIKNLSIDELIFAINKLHIIGDYEKYKDLQEICFTALTSKAPLEALEMYETAHYKNGPDLNSIIHKIAYTDIAMALELSIRYKDSLPKNATEGLAAIIAGNDPENALMRIKEYKLKPSLADYKIIFKEIANLDISLAVQQLMSLNAQQQKPAALGISDVLIKSENLHSFLSTSNSDLEPIVYTTVLKEWAKKYPADALSWHLETNKDNHHVSTIIKNTWLKKDPISAANWIVENTPIGQNPYSQITKSAFNRKGSKKLLDWLKLQPQSSMKDDAHIALIPDCRSMKFKIDLIKNIADSQKREIEANKIRVLLMNNEI